MAIHRGTLSRQEAARCVLTAPTNSTPGTSPGTSLGTSVSPSASASASPTPGGAAAGDRWRHGESCFNMKGIIIIVNITSRRHVSTSFTCRERLLIHCHIVKETNLIYILINNIFPCFNLYRTCYETDSRDNASYHIRFYL